MHMRVQFAQSGHCQSRDIFLEHGCTTILHNRFHSLVRQLIFKYGRSYANVSLLVVPLEVSKHLLRPNGADRSYSLTLET